MSSYYDGLVAATVRAIKARDAARVAHDVALAALEEAENAEQQAWAELRGAQDTQVQNALRQ